MDRERQRLARGLARTKGIDLSADYHALSISDKAALSDVARTVGYRDPKSASGRSKGYSFFLYLNKGV